MMFSGARCRIPRVVSVSMWVVTAALSGCGGGGSGRDAGGGLDAPAPDAPLPPGADAPGFGRPDAATLERPDSMAPPGTLCEDSCGSAADMECDDGGPDSLYSVCAFGTDCSDCGPRNPADCVPRCEERNCGDNGCGGTCGECAEPETCMGGTCSVCTPDCSDATCGDDGCGGSCGECTGSAVCSRGTCRTPDCAGRECGSDGAGGTCGSMDGRCAEGSGCRDGRCVPCDCAGRTCGAALGCESCGECPSPPMGMALCDRLTGMCLPAATPANCNDTCRYSGDNECDDGRPGAHTSLCDPGTDCTDCGPM